MLVTNSIPPIRIHHPSRYASEPWRDDVFRVIIDQHFVQFFSVDPLDCRHFILIWMKFNIGLYHEYVVNLPFNPISIHSSRISHFCNKVEVIDVERFGRYPKFLIEFPNRCPFDASSVYFIHFIFACKWMGTT